jgi:hypothetical protein
LTFSGDEGIACPSLATSSKTGAYLATGASSGPTTTPFEVIIFSRPNTRERVVAYADRQ